MKNLYFLGILLVIASCGDKRENPSALLENELFSVKDFNPVSNFTADSGKTVTLFLDYFDAINRGFIIPSERQAKDGVFIVKFSIKNNSKSGKQYLYKILYQNESYKFPELDESGQEHSLAWENFYGSWEDTGILFKETKTLEPDGNFHEISDEIRIVGNPRNEERYMDNGVNNRWKRNPRTGEYRFVLLIAEKGSESSRMIPGFVSDISKPENNKFRNPFYFFESGAAAKIKNLGYVYTSPLKLIAKPDLGNGVYINPMNFSRETSGKYFTDNCGQDSGIYENAAFEQFINNVDPSMRFENIPVVRDVMGDDYTKTDYNWDKAFYKMDEMISTLPGIARRPCESVYSDPVARKIVMMNPGCTEGKWRKESVGIRTRHGFTYGKYRLKCKLTQLLNKDNVWNGLTNAIWLLSQQGSGPWNNRRSCDKEGFMATYWGGDNDKRVPVIDYSEIDFEILKTPQYCPNFNFPPVIQNPVPDMNNIERWNVSFPEELKEADEKISVACTNWDMACKQPNNFGSGCKEITYGETTFNSHRWTDTYRALTQKKYESDDELFASDYYYFEIDWRPSEIIWRIGPSPDNMRIVGYMNDNVTTIANNQMTLIVTQEYHNTKWWPGSPFVQENIPFPSKAITGEIYELVIE